MAEAKKKEFKPTPSQELAITAPIMDLLVSAAAGSGKTAVLSRRILRLVSEGDEPVSLSRMLIVTFTKAAAEELRMRIGKELKKALVEERKSSEDEVSLRERNLVEAIAEVESAEISTIHSFCFGLIKKYFSELGLSASLRIADENEARLMKLRTMEETVDQSFEGDPEFAAFAENLIELKDTRLSETLLDFYEKFIALPEGLGTLLSVITRLEDTAKDFENTPYRQPIAAMLDSFFDYHIKLYDKILPILRLDPKAAKYVKGFESDYAYMKRYEEAKELDFFSMCRTLGTYTPEKLGNYPNPKPEDIEWAKEVRDAFSKKAQAISVQYLAYTSEEYTRDARATASFLRSLYRVLVRFDEAYTEEKKGYGILDFADLERYAYKLLYQDGKPSEAALSVQEKYDAIFIDEYQDTNDLQDAIFKAISKKNRFMVGDIKQSIYGFRGAVPELFSSYRDLFLPYQKGMDAAEGTVFLSENFRCDHSVIDYSNRVFEKLFRFNSGRVPYLDVDALRFGKGEDKDSHLPTRLLLVNQEDTTEYDAVAGEILSLIRSGVKPKDIVILLRSMSNAEKYRVALDRLSVSCQCGRGDDVLFMHPEVLLLIALLNVIDNPTRDIYLAAALKSPIFGVTVGELALIRRDHMAISLYQSILSYYETAEKGSVLYEKLDAFFRFLEKSRRYAELQSSDKVVRYLLATTPLRAISVKYCGNCDALMAFYDYARTYEAQGFRGVHALCRLVAEVDAGEDKNKPKLAGGIDLASVRIMSIHASKGCEFDYVFLADTAKNFNAMDESRSLVYEKTLGVGLRIRESGGFIRYDTLIRRAISLKMREDRYDEEMRILYVALTRAVKQLIISASVKDKKAFDAFSAKKARPAIDHTYYYTHVNNYRDMLAAAYPECPWCAPNENNTATLHCQDDSDGAVNVLNDDEPTLDVLKKRLAWRYPYEAIVSLPAKLSVSRLHPGILDENAEILIRSEQADFDKLPLFMQDSLAATGAERGTATHLFMQFCDFEAVAKNGVEAEIKRLVEKRFITEAIAKLIYQDRLKTFFRSPLFERIRLAKEVYREERFNVRVKASLLTEISEKREAFKDEYVLVQGVVDCLIKEADGSLILIDYKTDHTPRDRAEAEAMLRERYASQLFYYRMALEDIYKTPVKESLLYSFSLGDIVSI